MVTAQAVPHSVRERNTAVVCLDSFTAKILLLKLPENNPPCLSESGASLFSYHHVRVSTLGKQCLKLNFFWSCKKQQINQSKNTLIFFFFFLRKKPTPSLYWGQCSSTSNQHSPSLLPTNTAFPANTQMQPFL